MTQTLNVLLILFGLLTTICGVLLGASFSKADQKKHPKLKTLDGKKVLLFTLTIVFLLLTAITQGILLTTKPSSLEQTQGPGGEAIQKATTTGFKKELEEGAAELKSEAEDYFNAAERDFAATRYQEAANNYLKSIDAIPTMSAYLNRGISLWNISVYAQAEDTFISGLQMAQKKQNKEFEGAFRGNIGIVYRNQGKLEEALKSHQAALAIDKEIGNPLGQAADLNNIGNVYFSQGKLEEALKSYQAALTINKEIGNPLGQATNLDNIGKVYFNQGKLEEALKLLMEARAIYSEVGALGELQRIEQLIEKLKSP